MGNAAAQIAELTRLVKQLTGKVQALEAQLSTIDRPISQVSVLHKPHGGGYVAYIQMMN